MDGISAAASIVGIAAAGVQVSIKIITLAEQVSTASDRISAIGNDISLTANILQQLGDLIREKPDCENVSIFSRDGLDTTVVSAEMCRRIFQEVAEEIAKASHILKSKKHRIGEKVKLTVLEKAKWPFLQPRLDVLRRDLGEAKSTLMLMVQVNIIVYHLILDLKTDGSRWRV